MTTSLLAPAQWAQTEFALARLGDQRLTQRLVRIGTGLAQNPGGTLPQAFPNMKDLKAAYRFFNQPKVGPQQIQTAHWQQTLEGCRQSGEYLLIEDTSELDHRNHPGCEDLGPIGNGRGRGLLLHSTLAVRVQSWDLAQRPEGIVVGLLGQRCWRRSGPAKRGRETWKERIQRPRESQRWAAVLAIVAVRLLNAKWLARKRGAQPVDRHMFGEQALEILAAKFGELAGGWTHQSALVAVARLGGFLARKHDGMPGWQTIWRGWQRLMWMCEGLEILQQT